MNPLELRQTLDEYQLHWRNVDSTRQILGGLIILTVIAIVYITHFVWKRYKHYEFSKEFRNEGRAKLGCKGIEFKGHVI